MGRRRRREAAASRTAETDDFSYNVVENGVAVRDLHATILHQLGIDHEKLSFPFQGLDQRLTGVEENARRQGHRQLKFRSVRTSPAGWHRRLASVVSQDWERSGRRPG